MKLKFYLIIICLIIFGCKSKEEPVYITRIGELTPGNGGIPHLEVYVDKEDRQYDIYRLIFKSGTDVDTLPYHETAKIIGEEWNQWFDLGNGNKRYDLYIIVKSMEIIQPEE